MVHPTTNNQQHSDQAIAKQAKGFAKSKKHG
jgi:hypothetical protein